MSKSPSIPLTIFTCLILPYPLPQIANFEAHSNSIKGSINTCKIPNLWGHIERCLSLTFIRNSNWMSQLTVKIELSY